MTIFTFIKSAYITFKDLSFQKKFINENVLPYLTDMERRYQGSFPAYQKHKMLYYGLHTPVVLGGNFKRLSGQVFTEKDRYSATLTGVATAVLDDLFDDQQVSTELIKRLMLEPGSVQAVGFTEKVARDISAFLLNAAADKTSYLEIVEKLFFIQRESLRQFDPAIPVETLEKITYEKAGVSCIFFYIHLVGKPDPALEEVLYDIADLHQHCNDIMDIYKDSRQKISTPANRCRDFSAYRTAFIEKIRIQNRKITDLPFPGKIKKHFRIIMCTLHAAAIAEIDTLITLEKEKGKGLNWNDFERKDLLFDLEKPLNFIKWVYYIWKFAKIS